MAASTCRKCKRVVLSLENKLSILDRIAKGEKATRVASEFGIGNSTVRLESSVCSKERKIMRHWSQQVSAWRQLNGCNVTRPFVSYSVQLTITCV